MKQVIYNQTFGLTQKEKDILNLILRYGIKKNVFVRQAINEKFIKDFKKRKRKDNFKYPF